MNFSASLLLAVATMLRWSPGDAKSLRRSGMMMGKATARHQNHCAYVIEKTLSFTLQDGAAPYVKAEYNKCSWHKKCPTLMYRLIYKPMYKVAHKTVTELEWRCCPGYSGYGCAEGPASYPHSIKSMPPFKSPPFEPFVSTHPWNGVKGPSARDFHQAFPMPDFGPPRSSDYPDASFLAFPETAESQEERDRHPGAAERRPPTDGGATEGMALGSETEERIYRMEEDIRRLNQGLETLRGTIDGLEGSLRASLREDANRMLSALLSAAPLSAPASGPSAVGFGEIPGGDPSAGVSGAAVANTRAEELRSDPPAETLLGSIPSRETEQLLDSKLDAARTDILDGLEKRVESAETRCEERAEDVRRQCRREHGEEQERIEDALEERTSDLRSEMKSLRERIRRLDAAESCCAEAGKLSRRMHSVETSVAGLNQTQEHLRVALGAHRDHVEGMLEGRLKYVESKLNLTGQPVKRSSVSLEARMDGKLRELEERLLTALEELGNATVPALLEGHAVPTLETELESLRGRLEMDVDRVQKHLGDLEILCSSSCSSSQKVVRRESLSSPTDSPERHTERLNGLDVTPRESPSQLMDKKGRDKEREQLATLERDVGLVNHTLQELEESLGSLVQQLGLVNGSWHERESRLARQMKGLVQLAGHQAAMLGAGERKLTRLKGELQEAKRRLSDEVRSCQSAAAGTQKEVAEVSGRVAHVEDRCEALAYLAQDLEKVKEEAERQSHGFLQRFNGTLSEHSRQLSRLKDQIGNCATKDQSVQPSLVPESQRGDTFVPE
ncbi:EMILIN-3 [Corythoichthys intestinalis]|uniref:EMILIN-3 n=1 Tax=Corythoichthys intestinalis TaxID=161448 RepID=UPI0025A6273B|nr:EMILIN-3 [Corythoichthys intestinalis]XP_061803018.1 EMILIN-3-like [Nerophis lumbriciformis]